MQAEEVWERLLVECKDRPMMLQTKTGLHFNLKSNGKKLIATASEIEPPCKIRLPRPIYKDNFLKVFPYYERVRSGEKGLSGEILANTRNSVYIMAAIKRIG
ncbi:hypothetical protein [Psychrobacillus sp.]|uniref:hypothetical protein n=1 Tax=Psychrobacillus sp. TaxID=1871623 RepID=UPI0028BE748E|nr:hypothetical protein [Psychrobacillus sp.]